nr:DUF5916 domain-containing protein [Allomuricauda sp.]
MKVPLFCLLVFSSVLCIAQEYLNSVETIEKTNHELQFDGFLKEPLWENAKQFPFMEWRPDWGKADSLTTLYITFDDDYLYVALDAKVSSPEKIIARNLIRDGWYGDDYFAFQIDPNRTKKNAFVFSIYPTGARYDMAIANNNIPLGRSTNNVAYDMLWEGKTQTTNEGWQVEYRIPLSNLRFELRDGEVTGAISAQRTINHENRLFVYPQVPQNIPGANGMPSLKKPVLFQGLQPKKDLQITPYVLGSTFSSYQLGGDANFYEKVSENELNAGLDVRLGLTPSLTLDASLNTDFSQVEIDDQLVNLSRVSLFFPERRKFFQEQAGLFDFNLGLLSQLFYSRVIGIRDGQLIPIIGGVRLTGELGNWDIGALSLQTEGSRNGDDVFPTENFAVLRLRKKMFNDRSFLGLMATQQIRKDYVNAAFGIDGMIDMGKENFFIGSVATTLEGENYGDVEYGFFKNSRIALLWDKRKQDGWFYKSAYEFSGENFNPSMAFLLRERHHNFYEQLNYGKFNNTPEDHTFQYQRWMLINSDTYFTTDFSDVLTWYNRPSWTGRFFSGDEISIFGQVQYEFLQEPLQFSREVTIPEGYYFFKFFGLSYNPGTQRAFKLSTAAEYGDFFDGENLEVRISPEWNLNEHLTFEGSWRLNYLNFKERDAQEWINVPQLRLNWAYNLHLSGSVTTQYNSISDQVFAAVRLRYNFRDGHDLYLVYNQDWNTERMLEVPRLPYYNNRLFTVKYLYTIF